MGARQGADAAAATQAPAPAERTFAITRTLDAPRAQVFGAWAFPGRLSRWWGPKGFTVPFCRIDFRPGGVFHTCMRSPEGRDYWSRGVYREIVEPVRLVFTDYFSDRSGNRVAPARYGMPKWPEETEVAATFVESGGRTILTVTQSVPESLARKHGSRRGWSETLDRLAEHLTGG